MSITNIKNIESVGATGKVIFTDGTTTSDGTKADCDFYGGAFRNNKCFLPTGKKYGLLNQAASNKRIGDTTTNSINSHNTNVQGKGHRLNQVIDSTIIGKKADTNLSNAFVIGGGKTLGRNQYSTLFYQAQMASSSSLTEIFLGGVTNRRFEIDESYNRIALAVDVHATCRAISSTTTTTGYIHAKGLFQSTAGVLASAATAEIITDLNLIAAASLSLDAVSGTPDHIRVRVANPTRIGTFDWSVIIHVYEIRTNV